MVEAVEKLVKGAEIMAHSLVLITKRNAELEAANEAAIRRKSHKRKRVKKEGALIVTEGVRLTTLSQGSIPGL
jgi:hypothetical protein